MPTNTLLSISGIDMGDYAVRGLTMVLNIERSDNGLQRAGSGALLDLTVPALRKYSATISCDDVEAPDFSDAWQGAPVTVTSVPDVGVGNGTTVTMDMLVDGWTVSRDEWGCVSSWSLSLRQI